MFRILFLALAIAPAAFADPDVGPVEAAKAAISDTLKDAASARWQGVRVGAGVVCGEVNAKNSYGGYTGFQPFVVKGETVMMWTDARQREILGDALFEAAFLRQQEKCPELP